MRHYDYDDGYGDEPAYDDDPPDSRDDWDVDEEESADGSDAVVRAHPAESAGADDWAEQCFGDPGYLRPLTPAELALNWLRGTGIRTVSREAFYAARHLDRAQRRKYGTFVANERRGDDGGFERTMLDAICRSFNIPATAVEITTGPDYDIRF